MNLGRRPSFLFALTALFAFMFVALQPSTTPTVRAATVWVVNSVADGAPGLCDAHCTLREAVTLAVDGDEIVHDPSISAAATFLVAPITISTDISISGPAYITSNYSSRLFVITGNVVMTDVDLGSAQANGLGGAVNIDPGGSLRYESGTMNDNHATASEGGAIYNAGSLTVVDSQFTLNHADNGGGTITNGPGAEAFIFGSLFVGNDSDLSGGAISNLLGASLYIANSTFVNNEAIDGAAIFSEGTVEMIHVTISSNASDSAAVYNSDGSLEVLNTIIANQGAGANCQGTVTSLGNNIESATDCGFTQPTDSQSTNPLLDALAENGGPTQTLALLAGSPAINDGNDCSVTGTCPGLPTDQLPADQRGYPRQSDGQVDIGAFEVQVFPAEWVPAVSFNQTSSYNTSVVVDDNDAATIGWNFQLGVPVTLTALGLGDDQQLGLDDSHEIGVWDSSGTLLVSTTIPAGTVGTLVGPFRYVPIVPIELPAGLYTIGALYFSDTTDFLVSNLSNTQFGPAIVGLDTYITRGPTVLTRPATDAPPSPHFFGPTFLYETSSVDVTVTVPAEATFTFDGTLYTGPQTISVEPGSYDLATDATQTLAPGTRLRWWNWSNGGPRSQTIVVGEEGRAITGNFQLQHEFTMDPVEDRVGSVRPQGGSFYNHGAVVQIEAYPRGYHRFVEWSGHVDLDREEPFNTVTMNGPRSIRAYFIETSALVLSLGVNEPAPAYDEEVTFSVTIDNLSSGRSDDVVIAFEAGAGFEVLDVTVERGTYPNGEGNWELDFVGLWDVFTMEVTVRVLETGPYTFTAEVIESTTQDQHEHGNHDLSEPDMATMTLVPGRHVNLSATKSNGLPAVNIGQEVTYTITLSNAGPSKAKNAIVRDPAAAGLTKLSIGACSAAGGAVCPVAGLGAGQLNIASLEGAGVLIATMPAGSSITFTVVAQVTAVSSYVNNGVIFSPELPTDGATAWANDVDPVVDTIPPVVTLTGPVHGATYTLGFVPTPVCTTTDTPGSGVMIPAYVSYSGGNANGAGQVTASCIGGKDNAGNLALPVGVTYTVVCSPTVSYSGAVKSKVGLVNYQPQVTAVVSLNTATCAVTGVSMTSATAAAGAIRLNTATNWKAPTQPGAGQWQFAMQTPNATSGGVFLNNNWRALDGSTKLLVKFVNGRLRLYFKVSGMAPTGVGIGKAAIEAESSGTGLLLNQP